MHSESLRQIQWDIEQGAKGEIYLSKVADSTACQINVQEALSLIDTDPPWLFLAGWSLVLALGVVADNIPHDEVEAFDERAPELFLKYKPFLEVSSGCLPYPALNKAGDYKITFFGEGLKASGIPHHKCDSSDGWVYARGRDYEGRYAVMYSWYMPKDHALAGSVGGHRHDWGAIIVWLSNDTLDAAFIGMAYSAHGGFEKAEDIDDDYFSDGHPLNTSHKTSRITRLTLLLRKAANSLLSPTGTWERRLKAQ